MLSSFIAYLNDTENAAALAAKGMDVAATKTRLQTKVNDLNQTNADQEQLKVAQVNKTTELTGKLADADMDGSGMSDAAAGMQGKTTPVGKNFLDIRADICSGPNPPPAPPPNP